MEIRREKIDNYEYIVIAFNHDLDSAFLEKVVNKAKEDSKKVNAKSPNGSIRPSEVIYWRNIGGILAEETVKIYLKKLIEENKIDAEILPSPFTTYQEHRDIKIRVGKKTKCLEVRSSFNYIATLERVMTGAFGLIGQYTTSYKGIEPDKDFYITVIHRYQDQEIVSKISDCVEIFIIGGASKENFEKFGKVDDRFKQKGAKYLAIRPIINVPDTTDLFKEILDI